MGEGWEIIRGKLIPDSLILTGRNHLPPLLGAMPPEVIDLVEETRGRPRRGCDGYYLGNSWSTTPSTTSAASI
jgi:hypothetical protein